MTDRIPVKAVIVGGAATGLGEFAAGDTVPVANGGTGVDTLPKLKTALDIANVTDAAVAAKMDKAGGNFSGDIAVAKASPRISMNKAATGQDNILFGLSNGAIRWAMALGDTSTETGTANAGSNFGIYRYSDAGAYLATTFSINRNTGQIGVESIQASSVAIAPQFQQTGTNWMLLPLNYENIGGGARAVNVGNFGAHGAVANIASIHSPGVYVAMQFGLGPSAFQMRDNGVGQSSGGWVATSDQRVKYDNQRIENALDKVDQLTGYTYIRQDMFSMSGVMPRKAGLIAQDVLKVLPEAVEIPANYDAEKNRGDLLALDSYGVLGLLVEAIKELRAEVRELRLGKATDAVDAIVKGEPAALPAPLETSSAPRA